jgi:hypothetical protein
MLTCTAKNKKQIFAMSKLHIHPKKMYTGTESEGKMLYKFFTSALCDVNEEQFHILLGTVYLRE